MKVEQQGRSECMLATIAALGSLPLSVVRARAYEIAGVSVWTKAYVTPKLFWFTVDKLIRELKVVGVPTLRQWRETKLAIPGSMSHVLPATGKGSVAFTTLDDASHICAFEDGLIYDSNFPGRTFTLEEFLVTFGVKVRGIFLANEQEVLRAKRRAWSKAYRDRKRAR